MKETCRICGRELCGNQRRWIFHPTAKLKLQVLLSHALGKELTRDGRGEFACSKCTFMLDRMYRFDAVIARVEALSIERLQRLLHEKHRLRQCIGGLYRKTNSEGGGVTGDGGEERSGDGMVDISGLAHAKYCALLQDDLVYSLYESWADDIAGSHRCVHTTPRRCRGCSYWRVPDSDYEAVCKIPRKLARSFSCGPSTRYSASVIGGTVDPSRASDSDRTLAGRAGSDPSIASLDTVEEYVQPRAMTDGSLCSPREHMDDRISDSLSEEHMDVPHSDSSPGLSLSLSLCLLQSSRLGFSDPVLGIAFGTPDRERDEQMPTSELETPLIRLERDFNMRDMDELLDDVYKQYPPPPPHQIQQSQFHLNSLQAKIEESEANNMKLQEKLDEMERELRSLRQAAHSQERTIQGLTESISTKDTEAQELYQIIEGQNSTLCKLQEIAHRNQLTQFGETLTLTQLQSELVRVQSSLFSLGLELEATQRSLRQSQRQGEDLMRFKERLNSDLQEALQNREGTEKHNQVRECHEAVGAS
uniref:Uncharacterized protein n=1 Tax=Cynoglossus semilaevis TaxID=244447 RepID=A0A3P8WGL1_CYNSE